MPQVFPTLQIRLSESYLSHLRKVAKAQGVRSAASLVKAVTLAAYPDPASQQPLPAPQKPRGAKVTKPETIAAPKASRSRPVPWCGLKDK